MRGGFLAALAGLVAASAVPFAESVRLAQPAPFKGYDHRGLGRSRVPGKPGRAGDKLRRMAAERRIGTPRGVPA
ncbi:hypothetical protein [Hydrogenophaga intermedia]|uniref:Uncharacterized protein n=1 Tax=Hydrogenophaga intermedia TaxID=65786 RepID=A0A1L1PHN9_HYDIT|nr:hypothetical protein [Hydrogenophaga intermedia]TMU72423.1 hypothetical protein FGJ01_18790 [Hydrogenophaga intermedia]CDN87503.1 hypothetical protein BN948_01925 [Hydrogenophaga intermedia]